MIAKLFNFYWLINLVCWFKGHQVQIDEPTTFLIKIKEKGTYRFVYRNTIALVCQRCGVLCGVKDIDSETEILKK